MSRPAPRPARARGAALALALLGSTLPPAPAGAAARPTYGGELRIALPSLPRTADPALASTPADLLAAQALHATPMELTERGVLRPGLLASRPAPTLDGLGWRLTLREGLRFADGTPLTAADVAASLNRLARPGPAAAQAWLVLPIAGSLEVLEGRASALRGVQVVSTRELLVTLEFPFPAWPAALAALPAAVISSAGAGAGSFRPELAGRLERLVANEQHHRGRALVEALVLSAPDVRTAARSLEAGEVDLILRPELPPGGAEAEPPLEVTLAAVNGRRLGAGADPVRRALQALDRADLVRRFVRAPAEPLRALLPAAVRGCEAPAAPRASTPGAPAPDPDTAAAAGRSPPSATASRLTILVPDWLPDARAVAGRLQVKLFDAGLRPVLEQADAPHHAARLAAGDYDVALLSVTLLSTTAPLSAGQLALAVAGPRAALRAERALAGSPDGAGASGDAGPACAAAAEALRLELDLWPLYASGQRVARRPALHGWASTGPGAGDRRPDLGDLWIDPGPTP